MILEGRSAIGYAEDHDLLLNKYADPVEGAREGLSIEEAEEIGREGDLLLIWLEIGNLAAGNLDGHCEGCHQKLTLRDGLCPACTVEASIIRDCPGEAVGVDELAKRFWDEENLKTAQTHLDIATDLAQRVADYAKGMELVGSGQREIDALKIATRYLREAGIQLGLAGMPERPTEEVGPTIGPCTDEDHDSHGCYRCRNNAYETNKPTRPTMWVAFEDGERARRRVDKLLKWTAPEEPCTCTNEESDRADCPGCLARMTNLEERT